ISNTIVYFDCSLVCVEIISSVQGSSSLHKLATSVGEKYTEVPKHSNE
ncbi:3045_t:CDS:1, partial [Scutellospora calospora]